MAAFGRFRSMMKFIRLTFMAPFLLLAILFAIASEVMDTIAEWLSPKDKRQVH